VNCVYFIQAESGPIKIGFTTDVRGRMAALQTATAEELTLVGIMPGDEQEEAALHARFGSSRIRGEWFRPDEEIRAFISRLPPMSAPHSGLLNALRSGEERHLSAVPSPTITDASDLQIPAALLDGLGRLGISSQDRWLLVCLLRFVLPKQAAVQAVVPVRRLESISGLSPTQVAVGLARLSKFGLRFDGTLVSTYYLRAVLEAGLAAEAEQVEQPVFQRQIKNVRKNGLKKLHSDFEALQGNRNTERSGS